VTLFRSLYRRNLPPVRPLQRDPDGHAEMPRPGRKPPDEDLALLGSFHAGLHGEDDDRSADDPCGAPPLKSGETT
jgi:hypothetical protein